MQQSVAGLLGSKFKRKEKKADGGIGQEIGDIILEDDTVTKAGRLLMRDQWNTRLHSFLEAAYQNGLKAKVSDVRFHKARLSGIWGFQHNSPEFLEKAVDSHLAICRGELRPVRVGNIAGRRVIRVRTPFY